MWQNSILEFHCCGCFKSLKIKEIQDIERIIKTRSCSYCNQDISLFEFSNKNNYLKIHELKDIWTDKKRNIFCNPICRRRYNNELKNNFIFLNK